MLQYSGRKVRKIKMKIFLLVVSLVSVFAVWQDGTQIRSLVGPDELRIVGSFETHANDHLTLLGQHDGSLLLGAMDRVYNLSISDLTKNSVTHWPTPVDHQNICKIKGQRESECHNYVRVFHGPFNLDDMITISQAPETSSPLNDVLMGLKKHTKDLKLHNNNKFSNSVPMDDNEGTGQRYLVCGTHAFQPKCRFYTKDLRNYSVEFSGIGYSPFSPNYPSTSLLDSGMVYAGTVANFGGNDAIIYRKPLRTDQYYDLHLNGPSFVSSMSYGELVLFFFREFAVEHTNCGKAVFSRVARICKKDTGSRKQNDFTTFLKARLNCFIPGELPFYFDNIHGTTEIFRNVYHNQEEMIYAVFTTSPNSIGASAICAFSMKNILKAFDGPFKGQSSIISKWLPVPENSVPKPRPGQCSDKVPDSYAVAFIKTHPLMDEAVEGVPVLTITSNTNMFSALAVDYSEDIAPFHIIYVGTASGTVLKTVINGSFSLTPVTLDSFHPDHGVISQSWDLFSGLPIKSLRLLGPRTLLVVTETKASIIRVDNCEAFSSSCSKCVFIRDPHCGWNLDTEKCVSSDLNSANRNEYSQGDTNTRTPVMMIQAINSGFSDKCPLDYESSFMTSERSQLISQIKAVATIFLSLLSLMIGFIVGFLICKWFAYRQNKTKTLSNAQLASATLNEYQRLAKPIDLVVNVSQSNNINLLKNNLNSETPEKVVKNIYI